MPQDINEGVIEEEQIARIIEPRAQSLLKHRLRKGDIIIARRGELGRAAAMDENQSGWVCGTGCFLLRLGGTPLDSRFIALAYRHPMVQRQVEGLAVGTTMPSLNNEIMGKLVFPDMDLAEQNAIAERVEVSQNKIIATRDELAKLRKEKAGLMHDLLTGKVQVNPAPPKTSHVQ
jgi:type I restriction enzyme S subunit